MKIKDKIKLAYLVTHPIHYQSPLLKRIASEPDIDLVVFYQSDCSLRKHFDVEFGRTIDWGVPLLEGFSYRFLPSIGGNDTLSYLRPFNVGLGRFLRAGKFDALIIHGYNRPYHWAAILLCKILKISVFIRDEATLISRKRSLIKRLFKRLFFGLLKHLVEGFLSIGTANAQYYISNGIPKELIFSTPYAVDNVFFSNHVKAAAKRRADFRKQLNLEPGRPIVLYASKLQVRKRALDLFDAFKLAFDSIRPSPYLLYVGDGELKPALLKRMESVNNDSVRFYGFCSQTELPAFYELCDVFVLASLFETWGLVVNEAMNAGKAIIVSDQVGAGVDLVKDGDNGYIVPAGNVGALADSLVKVLADPVECGRMGMRSAEIIAGWNYDKDVAGIRQALGLKDYP
ncbi:MAG: glycosyltransferase family 4 protein [Desulfobacteraceae bacterium]|jgi:glycosyltransferase involved in cell wall biosynthesis